MSYDLLISTPPGHPPPLPNDVREHHRAIREVIDTHEVVEALLHEVSASFAKWFLEEDMFDEPASKERFARFCAERGLTADPLTEDAALLFLVFEDGAHLATVPMPRDATAYEELLAALARLCRARGLHLIDPQRDERIEPPV